MNISTKSTLQLVYVAAFSVFLLSSCTKQPININQSAPLAAVNFIQASPDQPAGNLYVEGGQANTTPFNYGNNTGYLTLDATVADSIVFIDASTSKRIFAGAATFPKNTYSSVFLAGKASSPELFTLTDTLAQPVAGNTGIRFVNLSPDAPAVDLVITGGTTLVTNKGYKGYSGFMPLTGNQTYSFEIHQAGTSTVLAKLISVKLNVNYIYTIWFHGLSAGTAGADGLALDYYTSAFYL